MRSSGRPLTEAERCTESMVTGPVAPGSASASAVAVPGTAYRAAAAAAAKAGCWSAGTSTR